MTLKKVDIYSDGGSRPNPGPGGYGVIMSYKGIKKEFSGGYKMTTNNRMELTGVITGLSKLKEKSRVNIYTDSQYTINGIEKGWAKKWEANNWMRTKKEKALNHDLWKKLLKLVGKHEVKFHWVKGHNGHEENERCDKLATEQILKHSKKTSLSKLEQVKKILNKNIDKNIKIKKEGDKCRKCGIKVEKKNPKKKNTKNKIFYYKYYLYCSGCGTNYFVDEAKVMI